MTLIEKLLCVDKEKATEKATKKIRSKKLAKLVGEDAEITIRELSGKRYNALQAMLFDKKGNRDVNATYDFNLMCCVHGVVDGPFWSIYPERPCRYFIRNGVRNNCRRDHKTLRTWRRCRGRGKKLIKVDSEASIAYALFRLKKWKPSKYYKMGAGERLITRAFLKQELQDIEKEVKNKGR